MQAGSPLVWSAAFDVAFGVFHLFFWKLLRWEQELRSLGRVNRAVMQILNLRLTYVFFLMAIVLLAMAQETMRGPVAMLLTGGMALFWAMRAAEQVWFFGARNLLSNIMLGIFVVGACLHGSALSQVWI